MPSGYFQDRLRLASAICTFFQTQNQELEYDTQHIVGLMRPRQLYAVDNNNLFGDWDPETTPFYLVIDLHVAISNMLIDKQDTDIDMESIFIKVSVLFYTNTANTSDTPLTDDGPEDINIKYDRIWMASMDSIAAQAAVHYGFINLDYLQVDFGTADDQQFGMEMCASSNNEVDGDDHHITASNDTGADANSTEGRKPDVDQNTNAADAMKGAGAGTN